MIPYLDHPHLMRGDGYAHHIQGVPDNNDGSVQEVQEKERRNGSKNHCHLRPLVTTPQLHQND